jgi:hypothetical protein
MCVQVVLNALVTNPAYHEQLLTTIKTWPCTIYSVQTIIAPIQLQIGTGSKSPALKEVSYLYFECEMLGLFTN